MELLLAVNIRASCIVGIPSRHVFIYRVNANSRTDDLWRTTTRVKAMHHSKQIQHRQSPIWNWFTPCTAKTIEPSILWWNLAEVQTNNTRSWQTFLCTSGQKNTVNVWNFCGIPIWETGRSSTQDIMIGERHSSSQTIKTYIVGRSQNKPVAQLFTFREKLDHLYDKVLNKQLIRWSVNHLLHVLH